MSDEKHPKIPVAVLGATGSVGQRFITLLARHPWFEIAALTASERSAGRPYGDAVSWMQERELPRDVAAMPVLSTAPPWPGLAACKLLFSALDSKTAAAVEAELAAAGHFVVTNAGAHRMDADVPLIVPEVNPEHLELAAVQPYRGALLANPNCSTIGLVMALKPLADAFGVSAVHVVTLQAISGAGIPGVPSMAIVDNLIPYIATEEEKIEEETRKILGRLEGGAITPAPVTVGAQVNRVAVIDGHTECVSVRLGREAGLEEIREALEGFTAEPQRLGLPSAPPRPVVLRSEPDRPQPRLDRNAGGGMAATVGRLRPCPILGVKFVVLSHNTLRGAAGGAVLLAELAVAKGMVPRTPGTPP